VKTTTERTPDCNAIVTVEVDDEQLRGAMQAAAQRISRVRPMPGFRPGKAPYAIVERAVGKDLLRDEAIDALARALYKQVLKDEKIDAYDAGRLDIPQKEPLILKFTIPTRPVVTLGDYRSIHLRPQEITVSDEEVNQVIERLQMNQAQMVPVTRPVRMSDLVTLDVEGGTEGQEPLHSQGLQVRVENENTPFPWLDQLVGANANETRTIHYTYSTDDENQQVAGKTATYAVTVTDVKEPRLPALDDELARSVSEFQTLDQLKGQIRTNLRRQKEANEEERFADEVVDAVAEQSRIAYPASMLEDEIDQQVARSKDRARQLGLMWEKYLQLSGKSEVAFRDDLRPRAEKRLKRLLVLFELIEAEKIEATSKEVDIEIDRRAEQAARSGGRADQTRRALSSASSRRDIEFGLKMGKTIERIVAIAKGEPTSGKIVTPDMVREEQRTRGQTPQPTPTPGGLITDPAQVRAENWPRGLERPLIPGQDR
jgi:trigger factor